ncbi:MAG TPA: hypothetical protein VGO67_17430 [Verrucomicrobiae bacterium]|jgi:hypothetical protein
MPHPSKCAVLGALFVWLLPAYGENPGNPALVLALSAVSVPEIPARSAELVTAAEPSNRVQTAVETLRTVSSIAKPGVLPYTVSAICRKNPETAGALVAVAVGFQPQDVLVFTRAALCAAPGQVEEVVFSACRALPALAVNVAFGACQQLPGAGDSIRAGLVRARPDMELYLEEAESKQGTNNYQTVIKQAAQLSDEAARARAR